MEKGKDDKKQTRKSRAKPLDPKKFIDTTTKTLLTRFNCEKQNVIIKELLFAVTEQRKQLIEQSREATDRLNQLNSELPIVGNK